MTSVKNNVRAVIQAQASSYKLYIDSILEKNKVKGLIDLVSAQVQTFVFSGLTRNFLLGYLNNRDIDFVLFDSSKLRIPISQFRDVAIFKNKFGGYKLQTNHITIDVWDVEKTWGIVEEGMRGTVFSLMNTVFFNFSAVVFDYNNVRFYVNDDFCKFYLTHIMEVVYPRNPRKESCIVNALYYADKFEFTIGESLRKWVVKHYDNTRDYGDVQISRFNRVIYSNAMISAFVQICSNADIYNHKFVTLQDNTHSIVLRFSISKNN